MVAKKIIRLVYLLIENHEAEYNTLPSLPFYLESPQKSLQQMMMQTNLLIWSEF